MGTDRELDKDNIRETHWIGEIVENIDPSNLGRCRVKVFGKFDDLPNDAIPWATPMNRDNIGAHHIPTIGSIVAVRFDNGNLYHPEYWFQINQNKDLKADVLDTSSEAHNVVSLVYDVQRNIRIYSSPDDGIIITRGSGAKERPLIQIDEKGYIKISSGSKIFLDAGDVFLSNTGESSEDENQPVTRGKSLQEWLQKLLDDYKNHFHPTGTGPSGPPTAATPATIETLSSSHDTYQQKGK